MNDIHDNDLFDAAMRARYRQAAGSVSPAARARLRQARREAATGEVRKRGFSWPLLFGGAAAAFAVAFGLNLRQDALQETNPAAPATVAAAAAEPASALDQDPDFYAWLGSSDAELVAVE
ncbi:hypothetical protein FCE95_07190 [Luteimonas gilva]|uniref:DUF3619 family protein n=1 Tax=Luteimonas gilva TaxID=2572684 RepID=A0A4U5JWL1_9GAMM|nr:hypothetical protein [Luteimonas gilva]TKR34045.1 hypothetical protein FCE95_07190 [Luteimonas gilva]